MQRWRWRRWWNRLSNPWSTDPRSPINDPQAMIHNQSTTSTVPVDPQPQVHKNALSVSVSIGVSVCGFGCVWFLIDFVVWLCVDLFNFWLILWCVRVVVVVVGGAGLRWWCLAVLSCGDVGGGARSVLWWWWDYELKRERESGEERMWGERNNTEIMYRRATVAVHICTVTVALVHLYTILHPLMCVFFLSKCVKWTTFLYFARLCNPWCGCS